MGGATAGSQAVEGVTEFYQEGLRVLPTKLWSAGEVNREVMRLIQGNVRLPDIVEGDIRDTPTVRRAMHGVTHVLHQAALPSVQRSVDDPMASHQVNATGTLILLIAARDEGVRRFVYASSSSVYGDTPAMPKRETMTPQPLSPYAVSKLAGEYYCKIFHSLYGLETVSLRYFNVFGPRQDPHSQYAAVVPNFVKAVLAGGPPVVYGDGLQSRDFTYVDNAVEANLKGCKSPASAAGRAYNVACGSSTTLIDLLHLLERITGSAIRPVHDKPRPGDVRHSLAAIDEARLHLGFSPGTGLEEGLRRTVAWFGE